jgi:hypothetical protein
VDLGLNAVNGWEHLLQLNSVHTLHLLIDDKIDVGLVVDFGGLQNTSNTTIAENDVVGIRIGLCN